MFVNLKIDKINDILISYSQIVKHKSWQTYIERSSFECALYLGENWPRCDRTPPLHCGTTLEEATSWVVAHASSWSAPNDTSSSLLNELAAIMCPRRAVNFVISIYTNLINNYIIKFNFLKKKSAVLPLY
jgi:hypothetical protein